MSSEKQKVRNFTAAMILAAATIIVFWPVSRYEFVNYDDNLFVYENSQVLSGITLGSIAWAFTTLENSNWIPLTWLSHMLDVQLYGDNPGGHHLTSLLLHAANTALLFLVLRVMTGAFWRSAAVAALFSLHPLHVESVAWVAERRDVLSTFFWMTAFMAYERYVRAPGTWRYLLVVAGMVCGLMAKPMLVTLPFQLLLLDYWPLKRLQGISPGPSGGGEPVPSVPVHRAVAEKVPLAALAAAFSMITYVAQEKGGAVQSMELYPLPLRFANATVSYVAYLLKTFWPRDMAVFYPHYGANIEPWKVAVSGLLLLAITAAVLARIRRRPYMATGWFWYLGTLVPVIGLVQVGSQSMADRYTYVSLVGIFVMIVWGAWDLLARRRGGRIALGALAVLALLIMTALTRVQLSSWQNSNTLFRHALEVTTGNWVAHVNLANAFIKEGRAAEAIPHYRSAIHLGPARASYPFNLANALVEAGSLQEAVPYYRAALDIEKDYLEAHANLAVVLARLGRPGEALSHFSESLTIDGNQSIVHFNMAVILHEMGGLDEATAHYREALRLDPSLEAARQGLERLPGRGTTPGGAGE